MTRARHTPGPWFVSGVRFRMNGGEWHSIDRYDEASKRDQNVACVGYDPRTGEGFADAHLTAAAPDLLGFSWPWNGRWWKPTNRRRDLIKAGALIVAEIERLDRAEPRT